MSRVPLISLGAAMKCSKLGCLNSAANFGNYCEEHANSQASRRSEDPPSFLLIALSVIVAAALAIVVGTVRFSTPVQTSAPGGRCALPEKSDQQLVILVGQHDGKVAIDCLYVGARGTYGAGRK